MPKGIYFIDGNSSMLSDMESWFAINDIVTYCGGTGVLKEAVAKLEATTGVDFIVISEKFIDGDCIAALKALEQHPAKKIVGLKSRDELTIQRISKYAYVLKYPYSYTELEKVLKKLSDASEYTEDDLQKIASGNVCQDNPFSSRKPGEPRKEIREERTTSFQERLKKVQVNKNVRDGSRILPQRVIAVHNQKGGVGKSTIAKELSIALRCLSIKKDNTEFTPKVCLCDFDLDSSDIVAMLNMPSTPNIMNWCEDMYYEAERGGKKPENIRFPEREIKDNYLQKHESGLFVLAAPAKKTESVKISRKIVEAVIDNLRLCDFDMIIMDTGPNIFDYTVSVLMQATDILAVSTCEVVSAKRIDGVIGDIFNQISGFNLRKMKLLINKYEQDTMITPDEIEDVLSLETIGVIPYYPEISNLNNAGNSAFTNRNKNTDAGKEFTAAMRELAKALIGLDKITAAGSASGVVVDGLDGKKRPSVLKRFGLSD